MHTVQAAGGDSSTASEGQPPVPDAQHEPRRVCCQTAQQRVSLIAWHSTAVIYIGWHSTAQHSSDIHRLARHTSAHPSSSCFAQLGTPWRSCLSMVIGATCTSQLLCRSYSCVMCRHEGCATGGVAALWFYLPAGMGLTSIATSQTPLSWVVMQQPC
jgi:hypothetical protein